MNSPAPFLSTVQADIDQNTTLCLACASSLPPLKVTGALHSERSPRTQELFITHCCGRPICPKCTTANPRLERYNPCLFCLGGVSAVRSGSNTPKSLRMNTDGALRDEDVFALGNEDEDTDFEDKQGYTAHETETATPQAGAPNPVLETLQCSSNNPTLHNATGIVSTGAAQELPLPKYYIARTDTLQGIALRLGLDGREICRLNNLPPSTLCTTPHLLHTRRFLTLPQSTRHHPDLINTEEEREHKAQHHRERAEKRFQTVTKEVDWQVAKAYIALVDNPYDEALEADEYSRKRKEVGLSSGPIGSPNLENRAIGRYLDDEEWETMQRRDRAQIGPSVIKDSERKRSLGGEKGQREARQWWRRKS